MSLIPTSLHIKQLIYFCVANTNLISNPDTKQRYTKIQNQEPVKKIFL